MASRGSYSDFFAALRARESGGDYSVVNRFGYAGAYQFGEAALIDLGYAPRDSNVYDNIYSKGFSGKNGIGSLADFLRSPAEQDKAAGAWFTLLWSRVRYFDLEFYAGQTLNGIALTKTGMIAATHLLGTQKLIDFVKSGGVVTSSDANGTTLVDYLRQFAGYDTPDSFVDNLDKANRFVAGGGNDVFNGGAGVDTVVYALKRADVSLVQDGGAWMLSASGTGRDQLIAVERLSFADGTLALDTAGNAGQAYRLYQAAFDRKPDMTGLGYWIQLLDGGKTLKDAATGFLASAEFMSIYGSSVSNTDYVAKLYQNVLHRAGEAAGMAYWIGQLQAGTTKASVLADFAESVENVANVSADIKDGIWYV